MVRRTLSLLVCKPLCPLNLLLVILQLFVLLPPHGINLIIRVLAHQRKNFWSRIVLVFGLFFKSLFDDLFPEL